jgi:hypothetical protein
MKVLINETQYKKILLESKENRITNEIKHLKKFAETVIEKVQNDVTINFKMLSTWGAAVGGIIGPLNDFISNGYFELNDFQKACILVATASILFGESKKNINKLISIIKEENIESEFETVLDKGSQLKSVFFDFMESLNITFYTITNIMSYAFIIPILPILWEMGQSGVNRKEITELSLRLISFGVVSISGNLIKEIFTKLIKRFR